MLRIGHAPFRSAGHHDRESATDSDVFLTFLYLVLNPQLRASHIVVMDDLRAHKIAKVREKIEARGTTLLYLLPYPPT